MKINVEFDVTPQEARAFFGLPDVTQMQEEVVARLQAQLMEQISLSDPEKLIKTWFAPGMESLEKMQSAFWAAASGAKPKNDG